MYLSRFLIVLAIFLFFVSWVGFAFPELFIYGRRSVALTKTVGEKASQKLAKFVGVPIVFLVAVFLISIGIDQEIAIQRAQNDNAAAQYKLATHIYEGDYQARNFERAISWYWRAASNGHAKAGVFIKAFLKDHRRFTSDVNEAFSGYRVLADAGVPTAQFRLGECYRQGMGISKDNKTAFIWYDKAAKSGHSKAMGMLGFCYSTGSGTKKNIAKAVEWYQKGAAAGSTRCQVQLGLLYLEHFSVDRARVRKAYSMLRQACFKNQTKGLECFGLGHMYQNGIGLKENQMMALAYFSLAAERGSRLGKEKRDVLEGGMPPNKIQYARKILATLRAQYTEIELGGDANAKESERSISGTMIGPVKTKTVVQAIHPEKIE